MKPRAVALDQHLGLCFALARRYRRAAAVRGLDLGDLVQEAFLGLDDASRRFDPARGVKFGTLAFVCVRHAVLRALRLSRPLHPWPTYEDGQPLDPAAREEDATPDLRDQVNQLLDGLSGRDRRLVERRFGVGDGISRSLQELADEEGLTGERVRQLLVRAMQKLRRQAGSGGACPGAACSDPPAPAPAGAGG